MTPDEIARLTDWQVLKLYHEPAMRRGEPEPQNWPADVPKETEQEPDPETVAKWAKFIFGGVRRIPKGG